LKTKTNNTLRIPTSFSFGFPLPFLGLSSLSGLLLLVVDDDLDATNLAFGLAKQDLVPVRREDSLKHFLYTF
jgi:hypothetical protein